MTSHHFLGCGRCSARLQALAAQPSELLRAGERLVEQLGFTVVETCRTVFPGGGATVAWILAESHLVLHCWPELGRATVDLHICDYRADNGARAAELRSRLDEFCFVAGTSQWRTWRLQPEETALAATDGHA